MSLEQGGGPQDGSSGPTSTPIVRLQLAQTDVPLKSSVFAAVAASIADLFRCTPAKVSTHVQSQTKLLPPLNGKTVTPSGRDPLLLSNLRSSKTDGRPAF